MVAAHDSKSCLARGESSSLSPGTIEDPRSVSEIFWRASGTKDQGVKAIPRTSRAVRVRLEPKIFWREDFCA